VFEDFVTKDREVQAGQVFAWPAACPKEAPGISKTLEKLEKDGNRIYNRSRTNSKNVALLSLSATYKE
jgi:hypothetical protein